MRNCSFMQTAIIVETLFLAQWQIICIANIVFNICMQICSSSVNKAILFIILLFISMFGWGRHYKNVSKTCRRQFHSCETLLFRYHYSMAFVSILLIILACILIKCCILDYRWEQSSIKILNNLPGPKSYPLIGSAFYFMRQNSEGNNEEIKIFTQKLITINIALI